MKDRISERPGRIALTPESGGGTQYYYMEMADNPSESGTPLTKQTFLTDSTEDVIFGGHSDRTINQAFGELGGNRVRLPSSSVTKLYTMHPSSAFLRMSQYRLNSDQIMCQTKDYFFSIRGRVVYVYSKSGPESPIRTITLPGVDAQSSLYSYSIYHNCIVTSNRDQNNYGLCQAVNLENGAYYSQINSHSIYSVLYVDNTYCYIYYENSSSDKYVGALRKTDMTLQKSISSTMFMYTRDSSVIHYIGNQNKHYTLNLTNWTVDSGVSVTNAPNFISFNYGITFDLLWYDTDTNEVFFGHLETIYSDTNTYVTSLYKINFTTNVCTAIIQHTSQTSMAYPYYHTYLYHLSSNTVALLCENSSTGSWRSNNNVEILNITNGSIVWSGNSSYGPMFKGSGSCLKRSVPSSLKLLPTNCTTTSFIARVTSAPYYFNTTKYGKLDIAPDRPDCIYAISGAVYDQDYITVLMPYYANVGATSKSNLYSIIPVSSIGTDNYYAVDYLKAGLE